MCVCVCVCVCLCVWTGPGLAIAIWRYIGDVSFKKNFKVVKKSFPHLMEVVLLCDSKGLSESSSSLTYHINLKLYMRNNFFLTSYLDVRQYYVVPPAPGVICTASMILKR